MYPMNIVAVAACPTGIAHTYTAGEKLEKAVKKHGHTIKVQTQGETGIGNKLTQAEIDAAAANLANNIGVKQPGRFTRMRKIRMPMQKTLMNPERILVQYQST